MTEYKIRVLRDAVKDAVERLPEDMLKEVYDFVSFRLARGGKGEEERELDPKKDPILRDYMGVEPFAHKIDEILYGEDETLHRDPGLDRIGEQARAEAWKKQRGRSYTTDYVLDETFTLLFRRLRIEDAKESVNAIENGIPWSSWRSRVSLTFLQKTSTSRRLVWASKGFHRHKIERA